MGRTRANSVSNGTPGQADFSKIAQRKHKFIRHVSCLFKKNDAPYCLEKPFISENTMIWPCPVALCATLERTPKMLSVPIFLGLLD